VINTGDAVIAARKAASALSKGDTKDAAFFKKVQAIVNNRKGSRV